MLLPLTSQLVCPLNTLKRVLFSRVCAATARVHGYLFAGSLAFNKPYGDDAFAVIEQVPPSDFHSHFSSSHVAHVT
jgi:hypothetical protein